MGSESRFDGLRKATRQFFSAIRRFAAPHGVAPSAEPCGETFTPRGDGTAARAAIGVARSAAPKIVAKPATPTPTQTRRQASETTAKRAEAPQPKPAETRDGGREAAAAPRGAAPRSPSKPPAAAERRRQQHQAEAPRPIAIDPPQSPPPAHIDRDGASQTSRGEASDNPFLAALVESAERAKAAILERTVSEAAGRRRPEPVSRTTTVEGLAIHAMESPAAPWAHRPGAPTVVLLHGAGLDHRDWTFRFFDALPAEMRVVAFDRPGFGRSERPTIAGGLPATQARLLRLAAIDFGVESVVVVGHSWGGAVAMAWGLDAPDDVVGVVSLAGAVMPWSFASSLEHNRRLRAAARMALQPGGMRRAALEAIDESFAPTDVPEGYIDHIATELRLMAGAAAATAGDVATVNGALGLQIQRYRGFAHPVELIYGGADRILSAEEQGVAALELLAGARLTLEPEAGHMIHHTHPEICVAAIRRALHIDGTNAVSWAAKAFARRGAPSASGETSPAAARPEPSAAADGAKGRRNAKSTP